MAETFPLNQKTEKAFINFKEEIEKALLHSTDVKIPLVVETDASDTAITATLNQAGRPVAFFFTDTDAHKTQTCIGRKGGLRYNRGSEKVVSLLDRTKVYYHHRSTGRQL